MIYTTACLWINTLFEAKRVTEWADYEGVGRTFSYLEEFHGNVSRCGPIQVHKMLANMESIWLMKVEICASRLNQCAGTQ